MGGIACYQPDLANINIYEDYKRLEYVASDRQRKLSSIASFRLLGYQLGKITYALAHPQAVQWVSDPIAVKMLTMYLAAKEYLIESGVPKKLIEIAAEAFGKIKGKSPTDKLVESVLFIAAPWHMRAACIYKLFLDEFSQGKTLMSYGSGSGIIEILALIASGSQSARVILVDKDPIGIDLAMKIVTRFREYGYDIDSQVFAAEGDLFHYQLPLGVDTVASVGLLHNYFSLDTANALMKTWFDSGAGKVITDVYYDPENLRIHDAELRIRFVRDVLNWKIGSPDGLRFCNIQTFCDSLPNNYIQVYDHGLNGTMVVT